MALEKMFIPLSLYHKYYFNISFKYRISLMWMHKFVSVDISELCSSNFRNIFEDEADKQE